MADEILMQVFVHGIVEHLKVHFIILVDAAELVPGQLGDEVLSEWLAGAEMSPVSDPGELGQIPVKNV